MGLRRLRLQDFRCFESVDIEFGSGAALLVGANASGKTTVLEAAHLLAYGRSFRTNNLADICRDGGSSFLCVGELGSIERTYTVGLRREGRSLEIKLAGEPVESRAELSRALPARILDSQAHGLLEGGPRERRKLLDWGVFHVEPAFLPAWRSYRRAIRQRNELLKRGAPSRQIEPWEHEMAESGALISAFRERYLESLRAPLTALVKETLASELSLELSRGWPEGSSLSEALRESRAGDVTVGTTRTGPHRADLKIRIDGRPALERVSRGQGKILAGLFLVAQLAEFSANTSQMPLLLVDDLAAELDSENTVRLWDAVTALRAQKIVTAISEEAVPPSLRAAASLFHVEHGGRVKVI